MPEQVDQDNPRLGEIFRSLQDFRSEFREAMSGMVRKDVYAADSRTFDTRISGIEDDVKRLAGDLQSDRTQRQNMRTGLVITGVAAVLSLLGSIITFVVLR